MSATLVLVHGAGHTAEIWRSTTEHLVGPSLAVNLPGRADKSGDLAGMNVPCASRSVAEDVRSRTTDEVILVGHSVAGTLLPSVASQLEGQVRQLVFVAGITAPEGQIPSEVFAPGMLSIFLAHLSELRSHYAGSRYENVERRVAYDLDSLGLSCEPMRWAGTPDSLPRTFVRCLRDQIQSRELQSRLIVCCGAQSSIDIDSGHTPAVDAPEALASVLSEIVGSPSSGGVSRSRAAPS